jgi:hypothetical protein
MIDPTTIAVAGFGGFMLNIMNLWEDSKKTKSERVPKDFLYCLFFFVWPFVGAALAYIYILDGSNIKPLLAFSVGLAAPTTIKSLMATAVIPHSPPSNSEP